MTDGETNSRCTNCIKKAPLHRAPLVAAAAVLIVGIIAGRYINLPVGVFAVIALASLLAGAATFRRKHLSAVTTACVLVCLPAIGAVYVKLSYFAVSDDHIVNWTSDRQIPATLRGQAVTSPQIYEDSSESGYRREPKTSFVLQAERLRTDAGWQEVTGLVRVTINEPHRSLIAGQRVELVGWLGRFRGPDNPGQFDWSEAMRQRGIFCLMSVPGEDGATILDAGGMPWYSRCLWRVRAAARQHWSSCGDTQSGRLVNALIIGERHPALRQLNDTMVRAGVAHFLSISGLHLGVFLSFVYLLCRLFTLRPRRAATVVLVVLVIYVALAEPRSPLLRSAIMAAFICLAAIFQRRYTGINALAAACILLLAIDPMQLFQAGFQLSFATVAGLILLNRPVRNALFGRIIRRRGLIVFRDEHRTRRWLARTAADWLMGAVSMCITAYIAAAPLVAWHFGLFSLYAAPLSLMLFPLMLAVLLPGYVSIALAWPMPNLSYQAGRLATAAADVLTRTVDLFRNLPGMCFELRPVTIWWALLCYLLAASLLLRRRIKFGMMLVIVLAAATAAATVWTQRPAQPTENAEFNLLAVGNGQCAILRTPSGKTFVFDAGTMSDINAYDQVISPFMKVSRLPDPTAVFVSHANTDHYNALPAMLKRNRVECVYLNNYFGATDDTPPAVAEMMKIFSERSDKVARLHAGQVVALDDKTQVEVLWPEEGRRGDLSVNDTSLVLRITCNGKSILLAGDIDAAAQQALLEKPGLLAADVLVLPHHGSWETTLPEFVAAVAPEIILTSGSHIPRPPADATKEAIAFYRRLVGYATSRNGCIQVRLTPDGVKIKTMR